jgi:cytochrome oxidase Cu insertion factor (SCO1/SenC/PrrC family)
MIHRSLAIALITGVLVGIAPEAVSAQSQQAFPGAIRVEAGRTALPNVPLLGAGGKSISLNDFKGKWVWLYLGFANCPGVCPITMEYLGNEYRRLKDPKDVQVAFVSVDPARDTPDEMGPYAAYFDPSFVGVTGERQSLDTLVKALGASYTIPAGAKPTDEYNVGHPNLIFVIDPQGRLAAIYEPRYEEKGGPLVRDFNALPVGAAEATTQAPNGNQTAAPLPTTGLAWCGFGEDGGAMATDPLMSRARMLGSGTSVLPASSPMRMWGVRAGDWVWMAHGDVVAGMNAQGGPRGALTWAAENWAMAHGSRFWGPGILDLRLMGSLEPFTLPPGGTPQLFQTGESYQNRPLMDRQHPHDLLMELSGRYTWNVDTRTGLFAYGGLAGEPAMGPPAFMHRPSSADNRWAPLGHHHQDAAHITYGVLTAGARRDDFQLEGSLFNGREPDENRIGIDWGALDSWSTRLSWFPGANWALHTSYGRLKDAERLHPGDSERISASMVHVTPLERGWWSTSLIWGQNKEFDPIGRPELDLVLQSYGLESQLDWDENHFYGRYELVDKNGLPPFPILSHDVRRVNALTFGAIRDLGPVDRYALGIGGDITVYSMDVEQRAAYGFNPLSFRVYLRLRPPTMGQPNR